MTRTSAFRTRCVGHAAAAIAAVLGAACAPVASRAIETAPPQGTGTVEMLTRRDSNVLVVQLAPTTTPRPPAASENGGETAPPRPRSSGTLKIVIAEDSTLEYRLTVYNDDRRTYRSARVYVGDPTDGGTVVATLFSDLSLSSRYIQVRGTATVSPSTDITDIVSRLRQRPSDFIFRLEPRVPAAGALTGSIPAQLR
jgi:hypothetical protein